MPESNTFVAAYESDCEDCGARIYPDDRAGYVDDMLLCLADYERAVEVEADALGFQP